MGANFPKVILGVCALICGAVDRLRREHLRVKPTRRVCTLEVDGDRLLVPHFSYLSGDLLGAALARGILDKRLEPHLDSFVRFSCAYVHEPQLVDAHSCSARGYKTTEIEVLRSFPPFEVTLSREQGLWLVQWSCRQLRE
jgi:hypothetical protein